MGCKNGKRRTRRIHVARTQHTVELPCNDSPKGNCGQLKNNHRTRRLFCKTRPSVCRKTCKACKIHVSAPTWPRRRNKRPSLDRFKAMEKDQKAKANTATTRLRR